MGLGRQAVENKMRQSGCGNASLSSESLDFLLQAMEAAEADHMELLALNYCSFSGFRMNKKWSQTSLWMWIKNGFIILLKTINPNQTKQTLKKSAFDII